MSTVVLLVLLAFMVVVVGPALVGFAVQKFIIEPREEEDRWFEEHRP